MAAEEAGERLGDVELGAVGVLLEQNQEGVVAGEAPQGREVGQDPRLGPQLQLMQPLLLLLDLSLREGAFFPLQTWKF